MAKTDTRDPKLLNHIFDLLRRAAGKQTIVTDHDTDIQLIENARGDAFNVYQQRIQLAKKQTNTVHAAGTQENPCARCISAAPQNTPKPFFD